MTRAPLPRLFARMLARPARIRDLSDHLLRDIGIEPGNAQNHAIARHRRADFHGE